MSSCRAIDRAAIDRGSLAEQMEGAGIDRRARALAQRRIARVAVLLPPHDRELLRIVATPDATGDLPGPSTIGRRLGCSRHSAHRSRARLFQRIRRAVDPAPAPAVALGLPPIPELADRLTALAGLTPRLARRVAAAAHGATITALASAEGVGRRATQRTIARAAARLPVDTPLAAAVLAALAARPGGRPPG